MLNSDIYAVVDLETTRTNASTGHIIQVAAAFVQNNKIINTFTTLVNPGEPVPRVITKLTGITTKMVKNAPYFEDVAVALHAMLVETIFVAHNVNFDLPFLNAEFERIGMAPLTGDAIDTEPLARILWPTAPSYRLSDLTHYLAIEHGHPHQADSDATATAHLLIDIMTNANQLPMLTLQTLTEMPLVLPMNSRMVFESALAANRLKPQPLPNQLQVVDGLAIRRFSAPSIPGWQAAPHFPTKKIAKEALFGDALDYREEQAKMMNLIYRHYDDTELSEVAGESAMILEAPTGMGKTLGYLFPIAYLAHEKQTKAIIAVPTKNLQKQVVEVVDTQLRPHLPFEIRAMQLKGRQSYLNLQSFRRLLKRDEGSINLQFAKAQMLVWLTQTLTGDYDELNLNNIGEDFLAQLSLPANLPAESRFAGHEFWERQQQLIASADLLVVNHAYLAQYAQSLGNQTTKPFLIIDEAQNLPNAVVSQSQHQLNFNNWSTIIDNTLELLDSRQPNLRSVFPRITGGRKLQRDLVAQLTSLNQMVNQLQQKLYRAFILTPKTPATTGQYDFLLDTTQLAQFWVNQQDMLASMHHSASEIDTHLTNLMAEFGNSSDTFSVTERQNLADLRRLIGIVNKAEMQLTKFQQDMIDFPMASVFWLTENVNASSISIKMSGGLLHTLDYFKDRIYPHFLPPIITGATLFTSQKSGYLYDRLNLDRTTASSHRFAEVFDYANQAQLLMVENAPTPNTPQFAQYLAQQLVPIATSLDKNILVLFNSHEMLGAVYSHLQASRDLRMSDVTLLAQGFSGTRNKIIKRLQQETPLMVLGAASFWEGVDLPGDQLRLVVMARLPFDQPDSMLQKAEEALLLGEGKQPFYQNSLPKAVLKMRQGIGRLLRTSDDYGAIIVYDSRLVKKPYGKTIRKMLPEQLPQIELADTDVLATLQTFFKRQE
ncbi:MAG: DEAD/DEAH box helicase [Lactobacillaceae bacterium]|jgi:ATP-dependent DNA helicase DinG|nr:DEAD/DEAH box helicase [Lactobacillaceae bacterium]